MLQKLCFFLLVLFCFTLTTSAQTVDEIIAKNLQARGGLEKIKAIKSLKQTGSLIQQGQELPIILQNKRPSSIRFELTIQGTQIIQAYDGQTGWAISPFLGTKDAQKLSDDQLKDVVEQADLDGALVDYKDKGHKVTLVGKEDLEGSSVYKLKVDKKDGDTNYISIDAENYLEIKSSQKRKLPNGQEIEIETLISDYKSVEGVLFPHAIENKVPGQGSFQIKISKIEVNSQIDDNIFKMPASTSK
ncbi:MAG: signal peptide protein [bacterium]|nr:MAG: signal peptide protein [bacterium]